jgi:hypothetical protein
MCRILVGNLLESDNLGEVTAAVMERKLSSQK